MDSVPLGRLLRAAWRQDITGEAFLVKAVQNWNGSRNGPIPESRFMHAHFGQTW